MSMVYAWPRQTKDVKMEMICVSYVQVNLDRWNTDEIHDSPHAFTPCKALNYRIINTGIALVLTNTCQTCREI